MSRNKLPHTVALACVLASSWVVEASAQPMAPLPPKASSPAPPPRPTTPPAPRNPTPSPAPPSQATLRLEPGVVAILRNSQPVALGLVLGGDGRIVTSRSGLGGNTRNIVVRYADGSTASVSVGHEDRASDLALLVPQRAGWTEGFVPASHPLEANATLGAYEITGKEISRRILHTAGPAGANALDVDVSGPAHLGSPALDSAGQAAGIIVASCDVASEPKCKPKTRLATVGAMRAFLRTLPASAAIPTAFFGVQGVRAIGHFARGVRVVAVTPGSPAALAKLAGGPEGDLILAVGGKPVITPEELAAAVRGHAPGDKVPITLFSRGEYRQIDVVLAKSSGGVALFPAAPTASPPPANPTGAPKDFKGPR